ncbi:hypothetical protein H6G06_19415 [Anabaena sphaerica FACHB-251]|uniref:Uncharacterized protein n=1 Tax=Anabaena sphaerica FACHB-251 TaxID=2692883 RepID=A0A927A2S7_9NOST|nr:hypothetical protein [Anabaena sphaerica]MBD2295581.1 hypothetical protein [Anabaena sphaerica FACHB-251]
MLAQFQSLYPNGSIISELVQIFQGKYIVRVSLQIEGVTRATGMAGADTVEIAEDQARNRALMVLGITNATGETEAFSPKPISPVTVNPTVKTATLLNEYVPEIGDVVSSQWPQASNTKNDTSNQALDQSFSATTTRQELFDTSAPNLEIVASPEPEPQPFPEITNSNVTPFTPRSYSPPEDAGLRSGIAKSKRKSEPVNLSDVIAQTDVQIERLGWTKEQGREHLKKTYGKLGRSLLSEEELLDFLNYLKSQPDPIAGF